VPGAVIGRCLCGFLPAVALVVTRYYQLTFVWCCWLAEAARWCTATPIDTSSDKNASHELKLLRIIPDFVFVASIILHLHQNDTENGQMVMTRSNLGWRTNNQNASLSENIEE